MSKPFVLVVTRLTPNARSTQPVAIATRLNRYEAYYWTLGVSSNAIVTARVALGLAVLRVDQALRFLPDLLMPRRPPTGIILRKDPPRRGDPACSPPGGNPCGGAARTGSCPPCARAAGARTAS